MKRRVISVKMRMNGGRFLRDLCLLWELSRYYIRDTLLWQKCIEGAGFLPIDVEP